MSSVTLLHKHARSDKQILTQVFLPPAGAREGTRGLWKTHGPFGAFFLSPRLPSACAAARAGGWVSWAQRAGIKHKAYVTLICTVKYTGHSDGLRAETLISLSIKTWAASLKKRVGGVSVLLCWSELMPVDMMVINTCYNTGHGTFALLRV